MCEKISRRGGEEGKTKQHKGKARQQEMEAGKAQVNVQARRKSAIKEDNCVREAGSTEYKIKTLKGIDTEREEPEKEQTCKTVKACKREQTR